jgi:hypothetical protein
MISNQKFFNKVKTHLLKQGRKCKANTGKQVDGSPCMYFNPADGTRCAVGGALPMRVIKQIIKADLNHCGVDDIVSIPAVKECLPPSRILVANLQNCHDSEHPIAWEKRLKEIAEEYDLEYEGAKT